MKLKLLISLIFMGQLLSAQTFTEMLNTPFEGGVSGSIAFSDIDGDGDQDVIVAGSNADNIRNTKLYTNDGMGNFTEVLDTPFEQVAASSITFSDVDGDNDEDVLITGTNNSSVIIAKLYSNDGMGNFTEVLDTPFTGVWLSSIAFSDVNGDNDEDVLIVGQASVIGAEHSLIAKLYTNDGMGNFTEVLDTPFEGINFGSLAFADVDGDQDQDVIITGASDSDSEVTRLYLNNGQGTFTEKEDNPFSIVMFSSIAFADVDGDNDQDVFMIGLNREQFPTFVAKLYTNDGAGNFTEVLDTPFTGVRYGTIDFADVDGDNDSDILITGITGPDGGAPFKYSRLYTNDGGGNFMEVLDTPFEAINNSFVAFSDVDGDNDQDVLMIGNNMENNRSAKLYINNSMISSLEYTPEELQFDFALYPNPSKINKLNVSYTSTDSGSMILSVFDINGHLLRQEQKQFGTGTHTFSVDVASLKTGAYMIQLDDGNRKGLRKFMLH